MKKTPGERVFDVLNGALLVLFGILTFYPFYYVLIYSVSDPDLAVRGVYLWPEGFTLINYVKIFTENNLVSAFLVSILRTVLGTMLCIVVSSMFAYGVSKPFLPFRKVLYRILVITMYFSVGIIPWYVTMRSYGLKNNFLLYILPSAIGAFYVVLTKTFFEQLPQDLEESATLDGAGYFRIFWQIVLPLSKPILATVALYCAIGQWNSWFDNFMLAPSPSLRTLPFILYNYLNSQSINVDLTSITAETANNMVRVTPASIRVAITAVVSIPIFVLYPFVQRYFVKGLLVGAVKG